MRGRPSERDYSARAEYAAALSWWQIIAETGFCRLPDMEIAPPERYGRLARWRIRGVLTGEPSAPQLWRFWAGCLLNLMAGFAALGFLTLRPGLLSFSVYAAYWLLFFVYLFSLRVLLFRAGGWDAMLEQRDQRRAKRAEYGGQSEQNI